MNIVHFSGMTRYEDLGFSLHRVTPKRDYKPHTHDYHEMEIILSGTAINSINDKSFPIGPGNVFIVGKGATHEISQIDQLELYNLGFNSSAIRNIGTDLLQLPGFHALFLMEQLCDPDMRCLKLEDKELKKVNRILDEMYDEYTQSLPGCHTALLGDFSKLIVLLSRNYSKSIPEKETWQMASALAKMEQNYADPISITDLANSVYLSERHFRRQFEKFYQQTPKAYLTNIRLQAALRLLYRKETSITDTALSCGFSDCNHFSRVFRQSFGLSPTEYRKQIFK